MARSGCGHKFDADIVFCSVPESILNFFNCLSCFPVSAVILYSGTFVLTAELLVSKRELLWPHFASRPLLQKCGIFYI